MHLSMTSPTPPLLGIDGDLYNLLFKGHTPWTIIFYNTLSLDAPNTLGQYGDLYIYILSVLLEIHYNYKIPTSAWGAYF